MQKHNWIAAAGDRQSQTIKSGGNYLNENNFMRVDDVARELADLTEKTEQKAQEATLLEKKIEKFQKQQIAVQSVEQI